MFTHIEHSNKNIVNDFDAKIFVITRKVRIAVSKKKYLLHN